MIDRGKKNLLGILVDAVDYDAAVQRVIAAARRNEPYGVTALAVHGVMTGAMDREHRHRLNKFDLIVPDGQPVRWGLNWLHRTGLVDRVYGPNLMLRVCEQAAHEGIGIFLLGSSEATLEMLRKALLARFPRLKIMGIRPSRFRQLSDPEKEELIAEIRKSGAQITFVGLGCPRQEIFVYEYRDALTMPLLAVGAAFPFHAGMLPQAPGWMQRSGLEWLFRFWQEPVRLWKRYMLLNPLYLTLLALQITGLRSPNPSDTSPPTTEYRFG
jgi:N-acetylglucosaminyldiphosphoundecaprenol N-acetyl-beta-D-mannosaminyltransferase